MRRIGSAYNFLSFFICLILVVLCKCLCSFDFALSRNPENPALEPPEKTLPDLLKEHTLPPGLFPNDITGFQFDENTKKITVSMPEDNWELTCKSCVLRFSKTVTGFLERGKLSDINGMHTEDRKISCIEIRNQLSENPKELLFTTDRLDLTKSFLHEFKDVNNGHRF